MVFKEIGDWLWDLYDRGLVAPGHKYMGPFNGPNRGEPTTLVDHKSRKHDDDVKPYGWRSYFMFQKADEEFLRDMIPEDEWEVFAQEWYEYKKREWPHFSKEEEERIAIEMAKSKIERDEHGRLRGHGFRHKNEESTRNIPFNAEGGQKRERDVETEGSVEKKLKEEQVNIMGDVEMEEVSSFAAKKSSGGEGGGGIGNHETPVIWHKPDWILFPETHTQLCRTNFSFSVGNLGHASTIYNSFFIRMNSWFNMFGGQTNPNGVTMIGGAANAAGIGQYYGNGGANNETSLTLLPWYLGDSSGASPNKVYAPPYPTYTKLFNKVYENYVVLETRWKITVDNPNTNVNSAAVVVWDYDTYGTSSTGNVMPQAALKDMLDWPNIHFERCGPKAINDRGKMVFSDVWRPNQVDRNVKNDVDLKTWSVTGSEPDPVYFENLQLRFFKDYINAGENNVVGPDVCVFVELDYVVQYKDRKVNFRYPLDGQTEISLTYPTDILQTSS